VERSLKHGYPCVIRAGSRRAALVLLHPLPRVAAGLEAPFQSTRAAYHGGNLSCSCAVLLGRQRSQVLQLLWKLEGTESGQPWGQLAGRAGSRNLGLVHRRCQAVPLVSCLSPLGSCPSAGGTVLWCKRGSLVVAESLLGFSSCGVEKKPLLMLSVTGYPQDFCCAPVAWRRSVACGRGETQL